MIDYTGRIHRYAFGTFDFGGGADDNFTFKGPKGKEGLLWDYGVFAVTESFAAGTNTPRMMIGNASDDNHYGAEFDFGALAADTSGGKSIRTTYRPTIDAGWLTYMLIRDLPADTAIYAKCVAGTGSGLTGMAIPFVDVIWAE